MFTWTPLFIVCMFQCVCLPLSIRFILNISIIPLLLYGWFDNTVFCFFFSLIWAAFSIRSWVEILRNVIIIWTWLACIYLFTRMLTNSNTDMHTHTTYINLLSFCRSTIFEKLFLFFISVHCCGVLFFSILLFCIIQFGSFCFHCVACVCVRVCLVSFRAAQTSGSHIL